MRSLFFSWLEHLRSSYWFVPTLTAFGAILLSILTIAADSAFGTKWIEDLPWLFANKPEGARAVLSTIAGSMVTVAGVTFSITIVSVMNVAGRYGPRILTNFMRDRGNQMTLGVFISTFIYCLLILRTVRTGDGTPATDPVEGGVAPFVPHFSLLVGILLALSSIGVLIYFIHHVSESLHISNVIARIGGELREKVRTIAPERFGPGRGEEQGETEEMVKFAEGRYAPLSLEHCGYIVRINEEQMMEIACSGNLCLRINYRPGEFVHDHSVPLHIHCSTSMTTELMNRLRDCFVLGPQRTPTQDMVFLVDELVEIATIALSPGINDPFTALTCLEWIGAGLVAATSVEFPGKFRYDREGRLRVIAPAMTLRRLLHHTFDRLRTTVASSEQTAMKMMELLADLAEATSSSETQELLRAEGDKLLEACRDRLPTELGRNRLAECRRGIEKRFPKPE